MKIERTELVAYLLIGIGAVLLMLTFVMAFILLTSELNLQGGGNLSESIGNILGPIVEALIKIMYLGIMGWVGSVATIRGIQLLKETRQTQAVLPSTSEKEKK